MPVQRSRAGGRPSLTICHDLACLSCLACASDSVLCAPRSLADGAVHAPGYTMAWDEACGIAAARLLALPRQAAFYGSVKARKRRFAAHCGRQRALHRMADQLRYGRGEGKKTVVGIGPGGFDSGSSPVKAFTQHLLRCKDFLVHSVSHTCSCLLVNRVPTVPVPNALPPSGTLCKGGQSAHLVTGRRLAAEDCMRC